MGRDAKFLEQRRFWGVTLFEHGVIQFAEQPLVDLVHLRIAGEQDKGSSAGDLEQPPNKTRSLASELGCARVRQPRRDVEDGLTFVSEVGWDDQFAGVIEPETFPNVFET